MHGAIAVLAFHHVYQPLGDSIVLSAIVAGIPLYILFILLALLRLPAWLSALVAMLSAAVLAAVVWGCRWGSMSRRPPKGWRTGYGRSAGSCSTRSSSTT